MITTPQANITPAVAARLRTYQDKIDSIASYAAKVEAAKEEFKRKNRDKDPAFRAVRKTLATMCYGSQRCAYCESNAANEVEHIRPKDLYPEYVFIWENFLYACGACNRPKNNKFAVFHAETGQFKHISRVRGAEITPPIPGAQVLIDPRREDPMEYIQLDLVDSFFFLPIAPPGTNRFIRADYTIGVLGLNDREYLPDARAQAFGSYIDRLKQYITRRDDEVPEVELSHARNALRRMDHPTVWKEMQRQRHLPLLEPLFSALAEALDWNPTSSHGPAHK